MNNLKGHIRLIGINNTANLDGGGLCLDYADNNTISGNIYGNTANNNNGGGVYLLYADNNTISGNICGNTAKYGGGLSLEYADTNIISGIISGNTATLYGSGLFLSGYQQNTISGAIITNNSAGTGIIFLNNSPVGLIISNCWIGGTGTETGIYEDENVTGHTLVNNVFVTNTLGDLYFDNANSSTNLIDALYDGGTYSGASEANGNIATNM